jgi:hypothetical protein
MTVQRRNAELVELLRTDFQHRDEASFAWESACSAFLALPMLRGFWPMSSVGATPQVFDLSGNGRTLTYNGNPTFNAYDLAPYIDLDGTGDYLERTDEAGLRIIGSEAYVATAIQGLTIGGWFWRDVQAVQHFAGKASPAVNWPYYMRNAGINDTISFSIRSAVPAIHTVSGTSAGVLGWDFCVGRFEPNNDEINITVNGTESTQAIPVGTTLSNTAANFRIGSDGTNLLNGRASLCFLCAAALPDVTVFSLYERTRRLFNG